MPSKFNFDEDFQDKILSLLLRDKSVIGEVRNIVKPKYFSNPLNIFIAKVLFKFTKEYREVPSRSAIIELAKKHKDYSPLIKTQIKKLFKRKIKNRKFIINSFIEFAQFKEMKKAILDSADLIYDYDNRQKINSLIRDALSIGLNTVQKPTDIFDNPNKRLFERAMRGMETDRIPTNQKSVNRVMNGGLGRKEFGFVMGGPKGFKTGKLVDIGWGAVKQRYKVLHITYEVSQDRTAERYERCISGLNRHEIYDNWKKLDGILKRVGRLGGGLRIKEFPQLTQTPDDLRSYIDSQISDGFYPDLLIVDYADLMKPPDTRKEKRMQLSDIYGQLRAIAQEYNIAVWSASQVNREAVSKKVFDKEDVAEDFGKMALADTVIALCQTKEEKAMSPQHMRIYFVAGREHEEGKFVYVSVDKDRNKIRELKGMNDE